MKQTNKEITRDLDFVRGQAALDGFLQDKVNRQHEFKMEDDSTMIYRSSYGFYVSIDLLILGGDFSASIENLRSIESGSVRLCS